VPAIVPHNRKNMIRVNGIEHTNLSAWQVKLWTGFRGFEPSSISVATATLILDADGWHRVRWPPTDEASNEVVVKLAHGRTRQVP
jgi:hypothetical protein